MNLPSWINPINEGLNLPATTMLVVLTLYLAARALLVLAPMMVWALRSQFARAHRVYRIEITPQQIRYEVRTAFVNLLVDAAVLTAMIKSNLAQIGDSHVLETAVFSFVWMEIWFYALHRVLHTRAFYFIHRVHHESKVTTPMTGMTFSVVERALIVGGFGMGLLAMSFVVPVSPSGVAMYFMFNYTLGLFGHSNIEIYSPAVRQLLFFWTTPTHHSMHHARVRGHYGLMTTVMDSLFRTEFSDYVHLHQQAYSGEGATKLVKPQQREAA